MLGNFLLFLMMQNIAMAAERPLVQLSTSSNDKEIAVFVEEVSTGQSEIIKIRSDKQQIFEGEYPFALTQTAPLPRFSPVNQKSKTEKQYFSFRVTSQNSRYIFSLNPNLVSKTVIEGQEKHRYQAGFIRGLMPERENLFSNVERMEHLKRLGTAQELLTDYLKQYPGDTGAQLKLAELYSTSGQRSDAARVYKSLEKSSPFYWEAKLAGTLASLNSGDKEKGRAELAELAKAQAGDVSARAAEALGKEAEGRGEIIVAKAHYTKMAELSQSDESRDRAKGNVDYVDRAEEKKTQEARWFSGSLNLDLFQYDSNVVLLSGNIDSVSKRSGIAFGSGINLTATPYRAAERDLSGSYALSMMYHPDDAFISFDTWTHSFSLPFNTQVASSESGARLSLVPGFSLNYTDTAAPRQVPPSGLQVRTFDVKAKLTLSPSAERTVETTLNVRNEKNFSGAGDNDASGTGINMGGHYIRYLSQDRSSSWDAALSLDWIPTSGKNYRTLAPTLNSGYSGPLFEKFTHRTTLTVLAKLYYQNVDSRHDYQVKLDWSVSRELLARLFFTQAFVLLRNFSNVTTSDYERFATTSSVRWDF